VHARRGSASFVVEDGAQLQAGDRLAFAYAFPEPRRVWLFGIDDAGTVTRYLPIHEGEEAPLLTGRGQLPVGLRLDARPGSERLVVWVADSAFVEAELRTELARAYGRAQSEGGGIADMKPEMNGDFYSVWFKKP